MRLDSSLMLHWQKMYWPRSVGRSLTSGATALNGTRDGSLGCTSAVNTVPTLNPFADSKLNKFCGVYSRLCLPYGPWPEYGSYTFSPDTIFRTLSRRATFGVVKTSVPPGLRTLLISDKAFTGSESRCSIISQHRTTSKKSLSKGNASFSILNCR